MRISAIFLACILGFSVLADAQITAGGEKHKKTDEEKEAEKVPSVKGELKRLTKELTLSEDQAIQVKSILEDEAIQKRDLVNNRLLPGEVKVEKFKKLHTGTSEKINEVLNDDQKKKYEEYDKREMERLRSIG